MCEGIMPNQNFCTQCGTNLETDGQFCTKCGEKKLSAEMTTSTKSPVVALILCIFLGSFGIHRFYVGKIGTGILMLITFGGLGVWLLVDLIFIVTNKFDDKQGHPLQLTTNPSSFKKAMMAIGAVVASYIVFAVLIVTFVLHLTAGMTDVINSQLTALRTDNVVLAYSYTSKDFQDAASLSTFKQFVNTHPSLKNNESSTFTSREVTNNQGTVKGTLHAKNGAETPVVYSLIKENGTWKILNIELSPAGVEVKENHSRNDKSAATTTASEVALTQSYVNKESRYSIKYPADWEYERKDNASIVFSGKKGTPTYYSTVNIQVIMSKKTGGKYETADELLDSIKNQATEQSTNVKFLTESTVTVPATAAHKKLEGRYVVMTYTYKGQDFKQIQYVIPRESGEVFYCLAYTAPRDRYEADYPIAEAMLDSWSVN